ncbi:MAG: DUF1565 domain-containing protein [Nocardioidaceae bacterium]
MPSGAKFVSTIGSDSAAGTAAAPFRTVGRALKALRAGDTLIVRGGRYTENVTGGGLAAGTAASRITVRAYPGERPVIVGLLWLSDASYWTFDGINVTWNGANNASQHMVKMSGGTGWRLTNAEIWGARSFAGILVAGTPKDFRLDHLYVHDTYASNAANQDHLVYVNAGMGGGVIEQSVFAHSPNGRGVKIGPPSATATAPIGNVVIRYNTFLDNRGPSNIQLSYTATNNKIYRNLLVASGSESVTAYNLKGTGNTAWENVGWDSSAILEKSPNLLDKGGNLVRNPRLDAGFRPLEGTLQGYGAFAG